MSKSSFRNIIFILAAASCLSGCAMITEMANTPADGSDYSTSTGATPPRDPYYRGYSNDASAAGIR